MNKQTKTNGAEESEHRRDKPPEAKRHVNEQTKTTGEDSHRRPEVTDSTDGDELAFPRPG